MKSLRPNVFTVFEEMPLADQDPQSIFKALAQGEKKTFLLESAPGSGPSARYTYIGISPQETYTIERDALFLERGGKKTPLKGPPLRTLCRLLEKNRLKRDPKLPPFQGGAVGYIGYDCARFFEPALDPSLGKKPAFVPEACLMIFKNIIAFDHEARKLVIMANVFGSEKAARASAQKQVRLLKLRVESLKELTKIETPMPLPSVDPDDLKLTPALGREKYIRNVKRIKEHIRAGDIFQCVLSDQFRAKLTVKPELIYQALRRSNPSPYMFYIDTGTETVLGASPEMLVNVTGGIVQTHPIAGTRPRGKNQEDDKRHERNLLKSTKEKAEHLMLVDLGRNDIGRVSAAGTVHVKDFMRVERYSDVMHLVSTVQGQVRGGKSSLEALGSCFPAGTLSGAPKIRAMQIISQLEPVSRGCYGGAIIRYGFCGDLDSCIMIRSMVVKKGIGFIQAGAGIVADSRPENEYQEVLNKTRAVRRAVLIAETRR